MVWLLVVTVCLKQLNMWTRYTLTTCDSARDSAPGNYNTKPRELAGATDALVPQLHYAALCCAADVGRSTVANDSHTEADKICSVWKDAVGLG